MYIPKSKMFPEDTTRHVPWPISHFTMPYFDGDFDRRTAKKQTGPRRLLVAGKGKQAISAEKQRAALGLDKDNGDDADNDDGASKPGRTKQARALDLSFCRPFSHAVGVVTVCVTFLIVPPSVRVTVLGGVAASRRFRTFRSRYTGCCCDWAASVVRYTRLHRATVRHRSARGGEGGGEALVKFVPCHHTRKRREGAVGLLIVRRYHRSLSLETNHLNTLPNAPLLRLCLSRCSHLPARPGRPQCSRVDTTQEATNRCLHRTAQTCECQLQELKTRCEVEAAREYRQPPLSDLPGILYGRGALHDYPRPGLKWTEHREL